MLPMDRRGFLGSSFATMAATLSTGPILLGQDRPLIGPVFDPDTLFLTWQRDPTTTMTVQWVGAEDEIVDATIQVAAVETDSDEPTVWRSVPTIKKPFPFTDLKVFRAEITGLQPGGEYRFRIGATSPVYRFRTMPAKATDALHFITGGDCGVNPHAAANNAMAARQDPWFVMIGGDLAYENGTKPLLTLGFLRNYREHMIDSRGRLIPMVTCLGNHEVAGSYNQPREKASLYLSLFDGFYSDTTYNVLDFGDYMSLVLLDTGHVSPIAGEQTSWLNTTLKERAGLPHLIVVNHVPAYPSYRPYAAVDGKGGTGADNRKHWVPLFENHDVDVVLEHHDHTFKRTHPLKDSTPDRHGLVYLGDGSWGKLRAPKDPEKRPYLAKTSQDYHLTLHRLEGDQRFHMAMAESGKVVDVCRTTKRAHR